MILLPTPDIHALTFHVNRILYFACMAAAVVTIVIVSRLKRHSLART